MLLDYLYLILRTAQHFKTSFVINLQALSTGLSCSLFIYVWVKDELRIDRFPKKVSRIYQLVTNALEPAGIRTASIYILKWG
jgi:hypothetical protein